jgi:hypothetical protein
MAARIAELEEEVEILERELDRREADHQEIIHRYEHVLTESNTVSNQKDTASQPLRTRLAVQATRITRRLSASRVTDTRRQADDRPLRERLVQLLPWR